MWRLECIVEKPYFWPKFDLLTPWRGAQDYFFSKIGLRHFLAFIKSIISCKKSEKSYAGLQRKVVADVRTYRRTYGTDFIGPFSAKAEGPKIVKIVLF